MPIGFKVCKFDHEATASPEAKASQKWVRLLEEIDTSPPDPQPFSNTY